MAERLKIPYEVELGRSGSAPTFKNIALIGAGGVGARVLPLLVKSLGPDCAIDIYDDDIVEQVNLKRQNFSPNDIGRYKAEVLATRYTSDSGPHLEAYTERYTKYRIKHQIIIGAVDNTATRALIYDEITKLLGYNSIYIDCGNGLTTGQVTINGCLWGNCWVKRGNVCLDYLGNEVANPSGPGYYPVYFHGLKMFPNVVEPEVDDSTPSCAVRVDDQTLQSNQWCATLAHTMTMWFVGRTKIHGLGAVFNTSHGTSQLLDIVKVTSTSPGGYNCLNLYPVT